MRSLNTGQDELRILFENHKPDLLALNETWIKDGQEIYAPRIQGYVLYLAPRPNGVTGGGVGFYVRKGLRIRKKPHPPSKLEQMWLELTLPGVGRMAVGTAYRPEGVSCGDAIDALSESLTMFGSCDYLCIMTDFNIDLRDPTKSPAPEFISFLNQHDLSQMVTEPTRVTDDTATLLDLIVTDSPSLFKDISVHHNAALSDHSLVIAELDIQKPKEQPTYIFTRSLNKIDENHFNIDLHALPWSDVMVIKDVSDMVDYFNELLINLFDKHAPLRRILIKHKPRPWLTDVIRLMMSLRDNAWRKALSTKLERDKQQFRDLRNLVNSSIKKEKVAYFSYFVNNNVNNPNKMWKNLKQVSDIGKPSQQCIPQHLNDANKINDFFLDTPGNPTVDKDTLNFFKSNRYGTKNEFSLKGCTESYTYKIITAMNSNASGHDGINVKMIQMTLSATLPVITHIINNSISSNVFPSSWKIARIKPIPKSSTIEQFKDLRPISILPMLSKILERLVCRQLTDYIESEKILPVVQSGFRGGHGTETALATVTDDIISASDSGDGSILVLLDFSRAFDCINTELLLAKIMYYGVSSASCDWFRSYLTGRKQYVETSVENGSLAQSDLISVSRGCPQGSILSPLLFILYTADLIKRITNCKVHLYADDTQLYHSFKPQNTEQAVKMINEDLKSILVWSHENALVLNPQKSKFLVLGTKHQRNSVVEQSPRIQINGEDIERVLSARNLGLVIDGDLRFEQHVQLKIRNAFYRLKVLYTIRNFLTEKVRSLLTESLVLSLLNYGDVVYGPRLFAKTERAIQRVQNACVRFCFGIPRRNFITPFLNDKCSLKMSARRKLHLAYLVFKVLDSKTPAYLWAKLTSVKDCHHMFTRGLAQNKLVIPKHRTAGFKGGFKYAASKIWNDLPPPLRSKISRQTFKIKLRKVLLERQIKDSAQYYAR